MDTEKLLNDINKGLQAMAREELSFPVAEELPPLYQQPDFEWASAGIQPAGGLYLQVGDLIKVDCWNSVGSVSIRLVGRVLRPNGTVVLLNADLAPTADRLRNVFRIATVNGFLLGVTATISGNIAAFPGTLFMRASIVSNQAQDLETTSLFGGHIANDRPLGWPPGGVETPGSGPGTLRTHISTVPAAGSDCLLTFGNHFRMRIISAVATLTTSAAVATRTARLVIDDGTNFTLLAGPGATQTAGQTVSYQLSSYPVSVPASAPAVLWSAPPYLPIATLAFVRTSTVNIQVGDQWTALVLTVEDWVTP